MSRMVKVELAVGLDLERPMDVPAVAQEARAVLGAEKWEALVLFASAVIEVAEPALVLSLAEAVKLKAAAEEQRSAAYRVSDS